MYDRMHPRAMFKNKRNQVYPKAGRVAKKKKTKNKNTPGRLYNSSLKLFPISKLKEKKKKKTIYIRTEYENYVLQILQIRAMK